MLFTLGANQWIPGFSQVECGEDNTPDGTEYLEALKGKNLAESRDRNKTNVTRSWWARRGKWKEAGDQSQAVLRIWGMILRTTRRQGMDSSRDIA